jgi:hypothetical protein
MHGHLAIGAWELGTKDGKPSLHYAYDEIATQELTRSQLGFGITTVRNPAAPTREGISLRSRVRSGELVGPRIITSGATLEPPSPIDAIDPVSTPAEARAAGFTPSAIRTRTRGSGSGSSSLWRRASSG